MYEKRPSIIKPPDLSKMQVVVIDAKTKIFIGCDEDPIEAKSRYFSRLEARSKVFLSPKKPNAT